VGCDDGLVAEAGEFELGTDGPKVILVGVDDSVTSLRSAAYAAGLARRQGARLVVVYVEQGSAMLGASSIAAPGAVVAERQALNEQAANLRDRVAAASDQLRLPMTFIVAHGDPYHQIKRIADEVRADAVVVGASTRADHRLIGSIAVRLVRAGRWPVTVVP
jgi:nucleotide-binding universal stress UspA family protein